MEQSCEEWLLLAEDIKRAKADIKKLEDRKKFLTELIITEFGIGTQDLKSHIITIKEVNRKGYEVKPTTYQTVSIERKE